MDLPSFVLSTLHSVESPSSSSGIQIVPRARTVVYRGMWASLPTHPSNPAELNPDVYTSDMITITTDARMEKYQELFGSPSKSQGGDGRGSGVGGPVEAVFWAAKANTQWRIRGKAYVIGPNIESEEAAPVREALKARMLETGKPGSWSWSRELTAHFGNLNPSTRGSFRNPPPGTPMTEQPEHGLELGQTVEDMNDSVARENFRVLVIVPEELDRVDLSNPKRVWRWNYKLSGSGPAPTWETTELWP